MDRKKYKYIIVVLTYRNIDDLREFIRSVEQNVNDYRIIVVNSYYDKESSELFRKIANKYDCDYINVPNRGYGIGNNQGIKFAMSHYYFDYLIVSNPDIIIKKMKLPKELSLNVYCGKIVNLSGKCQNPIMAKECRLSEWLVYTGFKDNRKLFIIFGIGISKLIRKIANLVIAISPKNEHKIFAAHGSFIIFSSPIIEKLFPVFDENIFLFSEEHVLAKKIKKLNFSVIYLKSVECLHKEDGSMKLWSGSVDEELRKSVIYCYENYCN